MALTFVELSIGLLSFDARALLLLAHVAIAFKAMALVAIAIIARSLAAMVLYYSTSKITHVAIAFEGLSI